MSNDPESGATSEPLLGSDGNDADGCRKKNLATAMVSIFMTIGIALIAVPFWPVGGSDEYFYFTKYSTLANAIMLIGGAAFISIGYFIEFCNDFNAGKYFSFGHSASCLFLVAMVCLVNGSRGSRNNLNIIISNALLIVSGMGFGWHYYTKLSVTFRYKISVSSVACFFHICAAFEFAAAAICSFAQTLSGFKIVMFAAALFKLVGCILDGVGHFVDGSNN